VIWMFGEILYGLVIDTIEFGIAVFSGWVVLRGLDWLTGVEFSVVYDEMRTAGKLHWYLAARFLGVCLLAAAVYGK